MISRRLRGLEILLWVATSTVRAGGTHTPFRAEVPLLKQLESIKETTPSGTSYKTFPKYWVGVGL